VGLPGRGKNTVAVVGVVRYHQCGGTIGKAAQGTVGWIVGGYGP